MGRQGPDLAVIDAARGQPLPRLPGILAGIDVRHAAGVQVASPMRVSHHGAHVLAFKLVADDGGLVGVRVEATVEQAIPGQQLQIEQSGSDSHIFSVQV